MVSFLASGFSVMAEPAPPPPRLFFELTLSHRLVGQPPVGIVRTEARLASHLLHSRPGLYHFCVFHGDLGEFVALDRDETLAILDPAPPGREPPAAPIVRRTGWLETGWLEDQVGRPARRAARAVKARALALLPSSLIELCRSAGALGMATAALCRSLVEYAYAAIVTGPPPPVDRRRPIDFRPGDVLISVGMAWQDGFVARLLAKKRDHGIKVVMFCHDLIPIDFPHLVAPSQVAFFQKCYADMVGCADKILCNSSYTRDRLVHFLGNFRHRPALATVELGSDPLPAASEWPAALPPLRPGRFVLCVSTIEIRKNHRLLYHLWSRLNETAPALLMPLVCVGGSGWRTDDLLRLIAADDNLRGKLFLLRGLADGDLAWLYRHCAFTLYPSFVEGWGLPVAESLAQGKYCVASAAPSIAELSQGLLDLLDPLDFAAWHHEVRRLLAEPGYLSAKERRIAAYRPRDWASAGEQFVAETAAYR